MKSFVKSLFAFSFCTLIMSCYEDKESVNDEPYHDTCTYLLNSQNMDSILIKIGSNTVSIPRYNLFPKDKLLHEFFRIPTIALTNKGTVLVSCENRKIFADLGEIDILLARKKKDSDTWEISKVFQNDEIKGRSMNPQFLVDRQSGRVYLFTCHLKKTNCFFYEHVSRDIDYVYKYSDDDGLTWSEEYSLKKYWDIKSVIKTERSSLFYKNNGGVFNNIWSYDYDDGWNNAYYAISPSCVKGVCLNNNTYLIPSIVNIESHYFSSLLINEHGQWRFSKPTSTKGDNECTVYIDNEDRIILDCRTLDNTRRKYSYDIENDTFTPISPSVNISNVGVSTEIIKDNNLYYMCFPNSLNGLRENLTLYGSKDGTVWKEIFRLVSGNLLSYGYSSIALDENHLIICYESPDGIFVQDISHYKDLVKDAIMK